MCRPKSNEQAVDFMMVQRLRTEYAGLLVAEPSSSARRRWLITRKDAATPTLGQGALQFKSTEV